MSTRRLEVQGDSEGPGLVVALDGPASSGKSQRRRRSGAELSYRFCDTGLLYRAVAWLAVARGIAPADGGRLASVSSSVVLAPDERGRLARVLVDDRDVTGEVHEPEVDRVVSAVAREPEVRAALLDRQREIAASGRIIMAGRDIGSVVLPDADLKIFLDASSRERARRRAMQRGIDPDGPAGREILADLERRDTIDTTRAVAPLTAAPDARHVVTDGRSFDEIACARSWSSFGQREGRAAVEGRTR